MFRNRWARRGVAGLIALVVLAVVGVLYQRRAAHRAAQDRLAAITAHLDATDPGWRLDQIEAVRGTPPDDRNSAHLVPRFLAALGGQDFSAVRPGHTRAGVFSDVPPNRTLDEEGAVALERALDGKDAAVAIARSFRDYPSGFRRYAYSPDFIGTLLPGIQETRSVIAILEADAERYCRDNRPGPALDLTRSMLGACRSVDPHPFLVACLVRIACGAVTVRRLERTLGLTEPKGRLADLQAELLREADADLFWAGVRGERAGMDMFFNNLTAGRLPAGTRVLVAGGPGGQPSLRDHLRELTRPGRQAADHAEYLEAMTRIHEARHLPEPEQRAAIRGLPVPDPTAADGLARLLLPAVANLHDACLRVRAQLRCAAAGLAAERFRRLTGRWPAALADIPKDILPAIPLDPFDGKPLKYARRADGVTIYAVGPDGQDNGGTIIDGANATAPGTDIGFRLYDLAARGLPPLPRPDPPTGPDREEGERNISGPGGPSERRPSAAMLPYPREVPD